VYCLSLFACCREVKKLSKYEVEKFRQEQEEQKFSSAARGDDPDLGKQTGNFILLYGC
jgi:hypothetical protein